MSKKKAIVIGAGIVGLAAARALALKGYKVEVFEKTSKATGASIRNFGMVWPIGQPQGSLYERAVRSRDIWREICTEAKIWHAQKGSLHLAYERDEMEVLSEFVANNRAYRECTLLNAAETLERSPAVNPDGLLGSFFSGDELIVNAREAIAAIPAFFKAKYDVDFHFDTPVNEVRYPDIRCGGKIHSADKIFICSGPEFESLYPELYIASGLTRCKLQMMRTIQQRGNFEIGPSLCGGLTLLHYGAFKDCISLATLKQRVHEQYPEYVANGIHVMISQNGSNEVIIGDSHEYGLAPDPFNRKEINDLIISYLERFAVLPDLTIDQSWIGIYAKMHDRTELVLEPEEGVTLVNGLGGAGMTLSFGLLEEIATNMV